MQYHNPQLSLGVFSGADFLAVSTCLISVLERKTGALAALGSDAYTSLRLSARELGRAARIDLIAHRIVQFERKASLTDFLTVWTSQILNIHALLRQSISTAVLMQSDRRAMNWRSPESLPVRFPCSPLVLLDDGRTI